MTYQQDSQTVLYRSNNEPGIAELPPPVVSRELKRRWSHFIRKVYETDPLVCPKCSGEMRIISFIDRRDVIVRGTSIRWGMGFFPQAQVLKDFSKEIIFDSSYSQLI